MSPERRKITGFGGSKPPPVYLVGNNTDVIGRNPEVEKRVRTSGEIGDAYRAFSSFLSSPPEKGRAAGILQTNGVEIDPRALAKLDLA